MPVPVEFTSPIRISAKERAFTQIQRWIIEGVLLPGEKLIDAELAETLSVSRTPIREALQLLEVQGLVSMHPGKETRVTNIVKVDILKMYPTLAVLHALAAKYATQLITPTQIATLMDLNKQFGQAVENGEFFQAMELDEHFHNIIVEAADNVYISQYSTSLQIHIRRFKFIFLQHNHITTTFHSVEEHDSMIKAFQDRDSDTAESMMKQNIMRPMNELYAFI